METLIAGSLPELEKVAEKILTSNPLRRVFAFTGEMGAGKTTLIKAICRQLGVKDTMSSPSFSLVNEYCGGTGEPVYHFDFYRIDKEQEAIDIGTEEYIDSGHYCFIEWAEKILHLVPEDAVQVHLDVKNETRLITIQYG